MATLTNLDEEIFLSKALEGYVSTLTPLSAFSLNCSDEILNRSGDNVLVPLIGALTATTFSAYNVSGGTASVITVSINKHKHMPVSSTDLLAASTSIINLESFAYQAGAALGLLVFQDIMSLIITSNFSLATSVSIVDFGIAQIRAGRLQLQQAKVPGMGRSMVLDVEPFDNLIGLSQFLIAQNAGDSNALREGQTGRIFGLDVFETNGMPGTTSVMGFLGHNTAIAVAMRYLKPQEPAAYAAAMPVMDKETGMTFGFRKHYDPNTGIAYLNLEANYGYAVGISNGLRVLKRAN